MNEFKESGGVRVGMANSSLATLTVNKDMLLLSAPFMDKLLFKPQDIIAIEPETAWSRLGQGKIVIKHKVEEYNPEVTFWTNNDPQELINRIAEIGFFSNNQKVKA
jgi:hypothetical protein